MLATMLGSVAGLAFLTLGLVTGLWTLVTARFLVPNVTNEPAMKVKIGLVGDFPPGIVDSRFTERYGVWVVNGIYRGRQQIYALRTTCTHLGCITLWQENERKFKCPCHGSGFRVDGVNIEGPAPRPLERCAIRIADDGQLEIDRSRVFRQELGQWEDPACFVI